MAAPPPPPGTILLEPFDELTKVEATIGRLPSLTGYPEKKIMLENAADWGYNSFLKSLYKRSCQRSPKPDFSWLMPAWDDLPVSAAVLSERDKKTSEMERRLNISLLIPGGHSKRKEFI
jgi:hypothetical protein